MKITKVRSWLVKVPWDNNPGADHVRMPGTRGLVFVQVDTDEGDKPLEPVVLVKARMK